MMSPKTAVLNVGGRKSLKVALFKPLCRNSRNVTGSDKVAEIQPRKTPEASAAKAELGDPKAVASHRATRVQDSCRGSTGARPVRWTGV